MDRISIKSSDSSSLKTGNDGEESSNFLRAENDSNTGKKGSQSSLDFGRGERRSPSPSVASQGDGAEMLKHVASGGSARTGDLGSGTNVKLPQRFVVKYLGFRETSNLWGIKYTRRPVDDMVNAAKTTLATNPEKALPLLKMEVTEEGIAVGPMPQNTNPVYPQGKFAIESISYGVQDLVYTRVFAMIVVKTEKGQSEVKLSQIMAQSVNGGGNTLPFRCHAFVCDSRQTARRLTYALASSFEVFSKKVAAGKISVPKPKKFAIDLRPAEEIEKEMDDSEA